MATTINQIRILINGAWVVLNYNSASGKYEKTITAPNITSYNINDNHYYPLTVEASDLAGNITVKTDSDITFGTSLRLKVKEQTAPTISMVQPTTSSYVTSNIYPIKFTINDESNGSGVNPDTIKLTIDSNIYTKTSVGMSLTPISSTRGFSIIYTPSTGLSDGAHTIKIDALDYDGNQANQLVITYTIDTVCPQLSITNPATNVTYVNKESYTIIGITSDITSGISYVNTKVNNLDVGNATIDSIGNFSKTIILSDGSNIVSIKAVDKAGKYTEISRTIYLDTVAPIIKSIEIVPNPVNTGASYRISVTATD